MSFEFLYKPSRADAVEMDELERWKLSYKANCECKEAIEKAISMYLDSKCVKEVFSEYGYDRTMWVLAATICCKDYDGRFSNSNKEWAKGIITTDISTDEMRRYAVDSHPAVLDGFTSEVRKQYKALGLLDNNKCLSDDKEYAEKLLILKPTTLKDEFRRSDFLGVADTEQLPQWAQKRLEQLTAPKMRIRVFQIDDSLDYNKHKFMSYDHVMKKGGVDSLIYRQVYGGIVNCSDIESVFALCNTNPPPGYCGHSLSVSDIVQIQEGDNFGFYYCDSIGFKKVPFDIEQTDHMEMLHVLIIENGKEPYEAEIRDELKAKQSVVGGLIEPVYFADNNEALIYCDEEFLFKNYEPNRRVGDTIIHGTFMVIGNGVNSHGEMTDFSLTDDQIEDFSEMFKYPLIYMTKEELAEAQAEEPDEGISQI